jgi:hypothetical protein
VGVRVEDELHPVAVLSIGGLLRSGQGFGLVLGAQESGEEGGGFTAFEQGGREPPGGTAGVAIVMEIDVVLRNFRKVDEGIDGSGGQRG